LTLGYIAKVQHGHYYSIRNANAIAPVTFLFFKVRKSLHAVYSGQEGGEYKGWQGSGDVEKPPLGTTLFASQIHVRAELASLGALSENFFINSNKDMFGLKRLS
jgi:hypothetical protein